MLLKPKGMGCGVRRSWIQILAFPSLNTFKSFLFTSSLFYPRPSSDLAFSSSCIVSSFFFSNFTVTRVQSAILSERLFVLDSTLLECSWHVFVPLAVHSHQETCFSRFCLLLCLAAGCSAAGALQAPASWEWARHCSLPVCVRV